MPFISIDTPTREKVSVGRKKLHQAPLGLLAQTEIAGFLFEIGGGADNDDRGRRLHLNSLVFVLSGEYDGPWLDREAIFGK
jgi:hypothetical protein